MNGAFAGLIVVLILAGLAVDTLGAAWSQPVVNCAAWLAFAALLARSERAERLALAACLLLATAGEVVLAFVWQLYDYRLGNLPLFVPPGHVLLYALGLWSSRFLPQAAVPLLCGLIALTATTLALGGWDRFSLVLTGLFLLSMRYGPSPRLYATMFVLALAMELWGTWLGNWMWREEVPGLGLGTVNPPFAAGAFYCVLDWLVCVVRRAHAARVVPARPA